MMSRKTFVPIPPLDRYVPKTPRFDRAEIGLIAVEAHQIANFEIFGLFSGHVLSSLLVAGVQQQP
jgi:hypothetical protein